MKKRYFEPLTEVILMTPRGMLCSSQIIDGEADEPAKGPFFDFDDEDYED